MEPDPNLRENYDDSRLDDLLRRAVEPRRGVADRIARAALAEARPAARRPPLRTALAALALVVLAGAIWLARPGTHPAGTEDVRVAEAGDPSPARPVDDGAGLAASPADPARLSITNHDGTVTVTTADGTRWLAIAPAARTPGDPPS